MKDDPLPNKDHITRYCKFKTLSEAGQPLGTAFTLREDRKERYLSVSWLEYFGEFGLEELLQKVRDHFNLTPKKSAKYAILNVGDTIDHVNEKSELKIKITHKPSNGNPSHSGIWGYSYEDEMIGDLIAQQVILIHPAIAPD